MSASKTCDPTPLLALDPWLEPHREALLARCQLYEQALQTVQETGGLLGAVSQGHHYFGLNRGEHAGRPGVWYREWAPAAHALSLIGDFNEWDSSANPLQRDSFGVWSTFLPDSEYASRLVHASRVKVHVQSDAGPLDRIPAYIRRVVQDEQTFAFSGQYWQPEQPYRFRHAAPPLSHGLKIYEAHVGMAVEEPRLGTYREFTEHVLPRIARLGYNAVQLMAVMEHPYYGSFGYHVSSFFAASSRFGTPEELKELIDTAHGLGLRVLLDLVHSHSVKNLNEGLSRFDGTDHQYFHAGPRGEHPAWDSLLFDYSKYEVRRFLLSNVRYWLEEFRFDGFRFDGVTSMLYLDHGLGKSFCKYDDYFDENVDADSLTYLMLANRLAHALRPDAITIAEDVSGMVGMARPVAEAGLGFDYRLAMGVPDFWIRLLEDHSDDEWSMHEVFHTLMNRRPGEKHVGYVESHDQALVGDKTIAFRLMDAAMYTDMERGRANPVIDRGLALHKLLRLVTFSLAGEGYLTFMGNEFGHPEWIDFPREGNGFSYEHARRQWSLADSPFLRYSALERFDRAMLELDAEYDLLTDPFIQLLHADDAAKLLVYRRGPLVFVFNFHPTESYTDLRLPIPDPSDYEVLLSTDATPFEGFDRVAQGTRYPWQNVPHLGRDQSLQLYLPTRTAQVLRPLNPP